MVVVAEYIWLDVSKQLRSKTKVMHDDILQRNLSLKNQKKTAQDLAVLFPNWNYDGSSTGQAMGLNSELFLKPVAVYNNPFREGTNNVLVLCGTYDRYERPLITNYREKAFKLFNQSIKDEPWFGIEQEYFIFGNIKTPKGYEEQGRYYCSVGFGNAIHREIAEQHLEACIDAGLKISGINAEVAPCQWEYQIGPCTGIESGDEVWVSRYLLNKIGEMNNVYISYDPKPYKDLNGSGCHTNFSTKAMREAGGLEKIYDAIDKLSKTHKEHMGVYGLGNNKRMSGLHETSKYNEFKFDKQRSVDRGASVRVGYETLKHGYGYFEDRRPASTMDPYMVTSKMFEKIVVK